MGKQGPCHHCGVTSTPLWRNGPPEKPVLCNACGSRWRTKGTLTNYTPLHARADIVDSVDFKISKVKSITIKTKGHKFQKRKHYDNVEDKGEAPKSDHNFRKVLEEDTSNRSSSGSAISYSESCAQFGSADASDFTGSAQSNVWDSLVPSKKRTCVSRPKPSSVEKLTKDLYCILHEQQSSNLSGSSEEELIFESETPLVSVEIGHGGVLIRHPNVVAREEESEASSLPIDNKACSATSDPVHTESKGTSLLNIGGDNIKKLAGPGAQEHMKRGKFPHDKLHILHSDSPLGSIDLRDVVSFEEFMIHLTHEEQQQLMKYLPYTDTAKLPESLKSMFGSPQFVDALYSFQQLLLEGIFDTSFPGAATEERRLLKRLALGNLTKSKWVERYQLLKDQITIITAWLILIWAEKSAKLLPIPSSPKAKWNQRPSILPNIRTEIDSDLVYDARHKKAEDEKGVSIGTGFFACGNLAPPKRPRDGQNQDFPETKGTLKGPKMQKCGSMNLPSTRSHLNLSNMDLKESYDTKDMDNDGSCFSPRSLFAFTLDRSSIMLDSLPFTDESSDQDLLFDVPPNAPLPQAELLHFHPCKQKTPPDCSLAESEVTGNFPSLSLSSQLSNSSILYPHLVLP